MNSARALGALRQRLPVLAGLLVALASEQAYAQATSTKDEQEAKVFFEQGKSTFSQDATAACAMFARSVELKANASAQTWVARCLARIGRVASAKRAYESALQLNRETQRSPAKRLMLEAQIRQEERELEPRIPSLMLSVSPIVDGLAVSVDEVMVAPAALGTALPVDPGRHVVMVRAPGFTARRLELEVREGEGVVKTELTLDPDQGEPAPVLRLPPATVASGSSDEKPDAVPRGPLHGAGAPGPQPADTPKDRGSSEATQRTIGWSLAAAGGVGLGVAAYWGIRTLQSVNEADCDAQWVCTPEGAKAIEQAGRIQTQGIAIAVASAVVTGAGLAVVVISKPTVATPPSGETARLSAGLTTSGAWVRGSW
jgi:hypothetical protein